MELVKIFYFLIALTFFVPWGHIYGSMTAFTDIKHIDCYEFIWGAVASVTTKELRWISWVEIGWVEKTEVRFTMLELQFLSLILWSLFVYASKKAIDDLQKTKETLEMEKIIGEVMEGGWVIKFTPSQKTIIAVVLGALSLLLFGYEIANLELVGYELFAAVAVKGELLPTYFLSWITWLFFAFLASSLWVKRQT